MTTKQPLVRFDGFRTHTRDTRSALKGMQVIVKTLIGSSICLSVRSQSTVGQLKIMIQEHEGISPDEQRLVFNGRQLKMTSNLSVRVAFIF